MSEPTEEPLLDWWIRPSTLPAFVYDPRVHSRRYVEAYLERVDATPEEVAEVLRRVIELEQQALALGEPLAEAEHGLDEVLDVRSPRFTPPGPPYR
jgi:hypothetical protein